MSDEFLMFEKVLDKGFVELIDMLPLNESADVAVVNAARVSYRGKARMDDRDRRLLEYLWRHKHTSPFEQVEFKFRIKAPVVVWWHIVKHRISELNMQSGRYTVYKDDEFYVPTLWLKPSKENKQSGGEPLDPKIQTMLSEQLILDQERQYHRYEWALEQGATKEQARLFLLGWTAYHTGIWKVNAHSLINFVKKRNSSDAQYETQQYGKALDTMFHFKMPWTWTVVNESPQCPKCGATN